MFCTFFCPVFFKMLGVWCSFLPLAQQELEEEEAAKKRKKRKKRCWHLGLEKIRVSF